MARIVPCNISMLIAISLTLQEKHNFGSEEDITEQQSPVSVLNSPFRDEVSDEEIPTSFEQKMANMESKHSNILTNYYPLS